MHLSGREQAAKLGIVDLIAEVRVEPLVECLLALLKGKDVLLRAAWVS